MRVTVEIPDHVPVWQVVSALRELAGLPPAPDADRWPRRRLRALIADHWPNPHVSTRDVLRSIADEIVATAEQAPNVTPLADAGRRGAAAGRALRSVHDRPATDPHARDTRRRLFVPARQVEPGDELAAGGRVLDVVEIADRVTGEATDVTVRLDRDGVHTSTTYDPWLTVEVIR